MSIIEYPKNRLVTQSNLLLDAQCQLTLNEKRLVLLGISKVYSRAITARGEAKQPLVVVISTKEWQKLYGGNHASQDIARATRNIMKKQIVIKSRDGKKEMGFQWLDNYKLDAGSEFNFLTFGATCAEHLQGLERNFTTYDLMNIQQLNSIHAITLYQLLMRFRTKGVRVITVEKLRFIFNLEKSYPAWKLFRQKVLKPAIDELNAKSGMNIRYSTQGRPVNTIRFVFDKVTLPEASISPINESVNNDTRKKPSYMQKPKEGTFIAKHTDKSWADELMKDD